MNNEKILYYLGILEDGALNYYQAVKTIRIARQSIQDYIEQLEDQNERQKEVISKLNFIKNRKNQGASQENINKMAIEFVNSYLNEALECKK